MGKISVGVKKMMKKNSLQKKLFQIFVIALTIPIVLFSVFMSFHTFTMLRRNTDNLMQVNTKQMSDNIRLMIDSYEDLLFQAYTDDRMVGYMDKINSGQDIPVTTGQIRRYIQGLLNAKDYIRAITVISTDGKVITYDQLTPATYESSWLGNYSITKEQIYDEVNTDNGMHFFPTEYAKRFAGEDYYLFHLAHRIIDYKDLDKENGIVILSLDEELLSGILQMDGDGAHDTFLTDGKNRIISAAEREMIGELFDGTGEDVKQLTERYGTNMPDFMGYSPLYMSLNQYYDESYGLHVITVTDQSPFILEILRKVGLIIAVGAALFLMDGILIKRLTGELADSVQHIVVKMKEVEEGDLSVRVQMREEMPLEIGIIAEQFNGTLERLGLAMEKQRTAEIKALEAQINPHFMYNTLDTINWMAIKQEEYDISNAINSLAQILRYAISNYNERVTIRDEVKWLKQYVFLQQYRFKNKFVYHIEVKEEIMDIKIHKLLLQPFVENAIIHGFEKGQEQYLLEVILREADGELEMIIRDNGKGMDAGTVDRINAGYDIDGDEKAHIGISNAINRIHMYCKAKEKIWVKSELKKGTEIVIRIPLGVLSEED